MTIRTLPLFEAPQREHARRASAGPSFDLKKITTPVLLHTLRGRMPFPALFLARCKLTLGSFTRTIDPRFPEELVRLAALPLWVYINLKKRIGDAAAFEVMRVVLLAGGVAKWSFEYGVTERPRTFENLCDAELDVNKSGPTRWNTMRVVARSERHFEVRISRCLYHELAVSVGVPEITPIVCQIDNAAFNSYLPDRVVFSRGGPGHRIADGASECTFVWDVVGEPTETG